jgi:hypothetical protein
MEKRFARHCRENWQKNLGMGFPNKIYSEWPVLPKLPGRFLKILTKKVFD